MATFTPVITDVPALARLQQRAIGLGAIGLLAGIAGAFVDTDQFFRSWLVAFLFVLGIALGSLALLMLQHLSGGQWGLVTRRVFEAAARTMPLVVLLFLPIAFGIPNLFPWARPEAANDPVLQVKAAYLNVTFFAVRAVIYFVVWLLLSTVLTRWSAAQDRGEMAVVAGDTVRFRRISAPGILAFVLTMTFASVDWVMSLDPHWFSTIYGLLAIASQALTALAFAIAVLAMLANVTPLATVLSVRHFHDLGKLLLAFVMLWAYLAFSQFLIIWSGNLPEEIPWYLERLRGGWGVVSLLLVVGHFALPFLLLLSRDLKRRPLLLAKVAIAVIVMRVVDIIWLVSPAADRHGFPIHWMDVALPAGLFGLWLFVFARNLRARPLLPLNDPYFKEAFAHDAH